MAVDTAGIPQRRDEFSWDQLEEDEHGRLRASVRFVSLGFTWSTAERDRQRERVSHMSWRLSPCPDKNHFILSIYLNINVLSLFIRRRMCLGSKLEGKGCLLCSKASREGSQSGEV